MAIKAYSLRLNGAENLGDFFKVREFRCRDGSDTIFIDSRLPEVLNQIRAHFGKPVIIHSGYRTESYNAKVDGAMYSQHKYGRAADISIEGVPTKIISEYARVIMPDFGGVGVYNTFVHVDVRPHKANWDKRKR